MKFSAEQLGVIRAFGLAVVLAAATLVAGYVWLSPSMLKIDPNMDLGERITFALKAEILIFI